MKRIKHSKQLNIIGSNVRKARHNAKLSQREVSEKLELQAVYICRGSLSRLEHGRRAVTDLEINAICKLLRVSPNDLFGWNAAATCEIF